jgi:YVTN family beta-propeller protein
MFKLWSKLKQFFDVEDDTQKRVKAAQKRAEVAELRAKEAENLAQAAKEPAKGTELRAIAAWYRAIADKLHQYTILLLLQKERRRITAWIQIQKKKKDGQYLTQAGRYLKVSLDSICTDESFTVLGMVLTFLEAEVKTSQDWQAIAYVTNYASHTVSVISTNDHKVIATIPVGGYSTGVAITPDGMKVYVMNNDGNTVTVIVTNNHAVITTVKVVNLSGYVSVIAKNGHRVIATIHPGKQPSGVAIGKCLIWQ